MLYILSLLSLLTIVLAQTVTTYPGTVQNGASTVQYTVQSSSFDGPKIDFYNATSAQWWYFDVVSNDLTQSVVITFMGNSPGATGTPAGTLPFNFIEVNLQLVNGTLVALSAGAESITITTTGDGSAGVMEGAGYSWSEASDLSTLTITIDDTTNDFSGTIQFTSDAPHHASCGPATVGATLKVAENIGWANAIPDATTDVQFTLGGEQISYTGRGYHDSSWGDKPFADDLGSWYWGHAKLGDELSLVYFDIMDNTGVEHQMGYLATNGSIIASSCGEITVRPTGANDAYPPVSGLLPTGFNVNFNLGDAGVFQANLRARSVQKKFDLRDSIFERVDDRFDLQDRGDMDACGAFGGHTSTLPKP